MAPSATSTANGATTDPKISYDPNFTPSVIAATGPNAHPRLAQIMPALIRHVHDFAREVNLTTDEYMAGVALLNWAGRMSDARRNEGQLVTDVLGLESWVLPSPFSFRFVSVWLTDMQLGRRDHLQAGRCIRWLGHAVGDSGPVLAGGYPGEEEWGDDCVEGA